MRQVHIQQGFVALVQEYKQWLEWGAEIMVASLTQLSPASAAGSRNCLSRRMVPCLAEVDPECRTGGEVRVPLLN